MKKIQFDDSTYIWVGKLNLTDIKEELLIESKKLIKSYEGQRAAETDGYGYKKEWTNDINFNGQFEIINKLDLICQSGIDKCKEIWEEEIKNPYNKINTDAWVNMVRSQNPVQSNFHTDQKYHIHTDINKEMGSFTPHYTYVYYIQMPDVMEGEDGVLYFKGDNGKEHWIRPEEDDLVVMPGWMPHAPMNAPKSTVDRIVMAGNVGFELIKKEKSLF